MKQPTPRLRRHKTRDRMNRSSSIVSPVVKAKSFDFNRPMLVGSDPQRILFLGDSITYNGRYIAYLETYLVLETRCLSNEFLNLGLPSETVSGLSENGHANGEFKRPDLAERLDRILAQTRPNLVFSFYGMNDGIYLPRDAKRFDAFCNGILKLHSKVVSSGAELIFLTPPVYDSAVAGKAYYSEVLAQFSDWLLKKRVEKDWTVVDVYRPMALMLARERRRSPQFSFSKDGIHPDERGHWEICRQVLLQMGYSQVKNIKSGEAMCSRHQSGSRVYSLICERLSLRKRAWLTRTGHNRPGIPTGLSLTEVELKASDIEREIERLIDGPLSNSASGVL